MLPKKTMDDMPSFLGSQINQLYLHMSKTKQNLEIQSEVDNDFDYQYDQWLNEQSIKELAERAEAENIFSLTGTYPY